MHGKPGKVLLLSGEHAGEKCRPVGFNCVNCKKHPAYNHRTRHSAKSSLCKAKLEVALAKMNLEL